MIRVSLGGLFVYFFGDVLVELVPCYLRLPESRNIIEYFLQLLIIQIEFQLF
jgi:hypothetical protein